jgi:hypothetical protein
MLPFYLLFRYEREARMLEAYRNALGQWWQNIEREKNPLWTLIYATSKPAKSPDLQRGLDAATDSDGSGGVDGGQFNPPGCEA